MTNKIPRSPFTTRLSTSVKETELRLRSIFQWKKKRPPIIAFAAAVLVIAFCGSLVGFTVNTPPVELLNDNPTAENTPNTDDPIAENNPTQENDADISTGQPETAHDWAGTGYLYYSAALEASIEFPPEWGSLLRVYDYENTVRIDTLIGWDDAAPDNGRMATIYKFAREDWDTKSGAYQQGMFEGGPAVQIIAEAENYVYILKRYGGLIGFKTLNDPGFNEYKAIDEALKNYELEIYINDSSDFDLPDMIALSASDGKTYPARRFDGDTVYEMPLNDEFFELLRSISNNLHPVDQPDLFPTLPGGLSLELSKNNGHISFFAGENQPSVLVRYVTDTVNEAAVVEDFALYTFLLASAEHKYTELHDLDNDGFPEAVVWRSQDNKRSIVIYDYYYSEPQCISVNEALGCTASEYTGQIANIKNEYNNLIRATNDDEALLYSYNNGQFSYVCTLSEALRS